MIHNLIAFCLGLLPWIVSRAYRFGVLGMLVPQSWRGRPAITIAPIDPYAGYETYGHPKPPVPYLSDKLPSPPSGMLWEISTIDQDGSVFLALKLVGPDGKVAASRSADLISNYKGVTWSKLYRDGTRWDEVPMVFNTLINPFVNWAQEQADKRVSYPSGECIVKVS